MPRLRSMINQQQIEQQFEQQNDQHPVSNLAVGEKLIYDVYMALRSNPAV